MSTQITRENCTSLRKVGEWKSGWWPVAFSPDNDQIAEAWRGTATPLEEGKPTWYPAWCVRHLSGAGVILLPRASRDSSPEGLLFSSSGRYLIYTDDEGYYLYEVPHYTVKWHHRYYHLGRLHPQFVEHEGAESLLFADREAVFRVDLSDPEQLKRVNLQDADLWGTVGFSPSGEWMLIWGETLNIWNLGTGSLELVTDSLGGGENEILFAFHPREPVAALINNEVVRVIGLLDGQNRAEWSVPKRALCLDLAFSGDGSLLCVGYIQFSKTYLRNGEPHADTRGFAELWDWQQSTRMWRSTFRNDGVRFSLSRDGSRLALSADGSTEIWRVD